MPRETGFFVQYCKRKIKVDIIFFYDSFVEQSRNITTIKVANKYYT